MGIKNALVKVAKKGADKVARLSVLSPEQLKDIDEKRKAYLSEMPDSSDENANELTNRLLAAYGVEIYNAYLPQISDYYSPIEKDSEYEKPFIPGHNIRYFNITKWVTDKKENSLAKLVNVYESVSSEECNVALVFHRTCLETEVYLAVINTKNASDNVDVEMLKRRIGDSLRGNFPGAEWSDSGIGVIPYLKNTDGLSVAAVSNIPTEKSEKFTSQTIEKLLDGVIPEKKSQEYTLILLATPAQDVEERKLRLAELYSGLVPYASWTTNFIYTEANSTNSSATFGVNAGVSAGLQQSQNLTNTNSQGLTDSTGSSVSDSNTSSVTDTTGQTVTDTEGQTITDTTGQTITDSTSETIGESSTHGTSYTDTTTNGTNTSNAHADGTNKSTGGSLILVNASGGSSVTDTVTDGSSFSKAVANGITDSVTNNSSTTTGQSIANQVSRAIAQSTSHAIANSTSRAIGQSIGRTVASTLGRAVSTTISTAEGISKGMNFGGNFGANFARSSNITATVGKNEGITQSFQNYTIKHTLELLEQQMKRMDESTALGMWDFAAYVISEDQNIASNVANSYLALTQGENSYSSQASVNVWRGDMGEESKQCREICEYLKELRHPMFALNPYIVDENPTLNVYPEIITATTCLSSKELAYSLNFPKKSIAGLPVIECAEFARDVVKYDNSDNADVIELGKVFHMHHIEKKQVSLTTASMASHTFISGSTGSGKSNTIYKIIDESLKKGIPFLVVEPAKGEYKDIFGNNKDVNVFSTNKGISDLLRINPFSFPERIHVFEHIDRLVDIFNVCWPMYAAMPAVLKRAIELSYIDCGWDLTESVNAYDNSLFPSFKDVARNIRQIIDTSEYDTENKGAYKGSLLTRLQSLTTGINGLVFTSNELSNAVLFDENTIIDLSRVGSSETKSLLMGMIILKLQEYRMTGKTQNNMQLRHITVLEEAHNILKKSTIGNPTEGGNLLGKSVEMISNSIAEMRTYGEGFVIADQAPGLLDESVIRNTNTKIIMRLPEKEDREIVGYSASLNDDQIIELSKLPCGVAAIYQNEWIQPVLCKIDLFEHDIESYEYKKEIDAFKDNKDRKIEIFDLLSKGDKISDKDKLETIEHELKEMYISSSVIVMIMKMLSNPGKEPRMTKMSVISSEFFPELIDAVRESHDETDECEEWTRDAEDIIISWNKIIDEQTRRDLIQSGMTYYLMYEKNNIPLLQEWSQRGGL